MTLNENIDSKAEENELFHICEHIDFDLQSTECIWRFELVLN